MAFITWKRIQIRNLKYLSRFLLNLIFSSVQFSHSVVSDSLQPHELQHARPPWPPNSWSPPKPMFIELVMRSNHLILCHPLLLLTSVFPSIRVFYNGWALCIRCQRTGASASALVLPMNIQGWFPLGLTGLIFLLSKGLSRVFSSTTIWKHQFLGTSIFYGQKNPRKTNPISLLSSKRVTRILW